ncbi:MAG: hypothetical protein IAE67_07200 [Candidatus Competibacteraceae bacterium]|nr:hypothetical protein [Candidatus Competibacteraceae bacterium]
MKKLTLVLFVTLTAIPFVYSQKRYGGKYTGGRYRTTWKANLGDRFELVGGVGMINFLGELGGANDIGTNFLADFDFEALRPNLTLGVRYRYNRFLAQKINFSFGWIKGADRYTEEPARRNRNLEFRSQLMEWGTALEFYFLPEKNVGNRYRNRGLKGSKGRPVLGYISTGINGFWFDPTADGPDGEAYPLQPLSTEGQGLIPGREPYSRWEFNIPVNLGFIFKINPALAINVEFGYRKTFTDYMDDVSTTYANPAVFTNPLSAYFADHSLATLDPSSPYAIPGASSPGQQRGDPRDNDSYMVMFVSVTYKFSYFGKSIPKYY